MRGGVGLMHHRIYQDPFFFLGGGAGWVGKHSMGFKSWPPWPFESATKHQDSGEGQRKQTKQGDTVKQTHSLD